MQKLQTDVYVCIPCITLATQINSEEEESENDDIEGKTGQFKYIIRNY